MELTPVKCPEERPLKNGNGAFPLTLSPKSGEVSVDNLVGWLGRNSQKVRDDLVRHGAILLRDCGTKTAEDFGLVTRALGCEGYDYVGGAAPRTEVVPGVVFTSNESPPDQAIPFHHELAQSPTPPSYILFMCERPSQVGGATPLIPSEEVANFFMEKFPDFAKQVMSKGVRYVRVMPEVTDKTSAQGRSWKETYAVADRREAEEAMKRQGTSWEWLENGDCKTTTTVLPALRKDSRTGKDVFFNSMVAAFTGWNDSRNVGEKAVVLGDGTPIDKEAIRAVAKFMEENLVAVNWKAGDIFIVDNTIVMHGRQTFEPPRRVLAAMRGPPVGTVAKAVKDGRQPMRVGILGIGAMGKEHIRNIALLGENNAIVTALCDDNAQSLAEGLQELGDQAPSVALFTNDEDLVHCDFVDALIICTPNFAHISTLHKAIPTGKHILCEKPLCTTLEDCEEVEKLLAERDAKWNGPGKPGIFFTGMEYRWMPPITRLIQEVDSKTLGEPRILTIREHRFPFLVKVDNWNRFNRFTGGTLVEKACHFFDLMRRILHSEPVTVYASGDQAQNHKEETFQRDGYERVVPDIIDHALVIVDFANGTRASLDLCMFAEDEQTEQVRCVCQRGSIESKSPESTVRVVQRRHISTPGRTPPAKEERGVPEIINIPIPEDLATAGYHEGATYYELMEFFEACRGIRDVPVTARDGKMAVAIGLAAQQSIATGKVVRLNAEGRVQAFEEAPPASSTKPVAGKAMPRIAQNQSPQPQALSSKL